MTFKTNAVHIFADVHHHPFQTHHNISEGIGPKLKKIFNRRIEIIGNVKTGCVNCRRYAPQIGYHTTSFKRAIAILVQRYKAHNLFYVC